MYSPISYIHLVKTIIYVKQQSAVTLRITKTLGNAIIKYFFEEGRTEVIPNSIVFLSNFYYKDYYINTV